MLNTTPNIPTAQIGTTDIHVSQLGFGAASLGNLYHTVDTATAMQAVEAAWDQGIRYFDTAPMYGFGLSERRLGDALRPHLNDYILSTKVGRLNKPVEKAPQKHEFYSPMPFDLEYDYSYDGVMRSFEDSLQRLGLSRVDILFMHDIGRLIHGDQNDALFATAMEGGLRAMTELREQKLVKAIGLGVNETEVCEAAMQYGDLDCFLLAGRYTLLEQNALQSFLPKCQAKNISVIVGGPYNSGILATGTRTKRTPTYNYAPAPQAIIERVQKLECLCDDFGVALSAAALQFPLAHPSIAAVIPGLSSAQRVDTTVAQLFTPIPQAFWLALRQTGLVSEAAPLPLGA